MVQNNHGTFCQFETKNKVRIVAHLPPIRPDEASHLSLICPVGSYKAMTADPQVRLIGGFGKESAVVLSQ